MIGTKNADYFAQHGATATAREICQQSDMWRQIPALLTRDKFALETIAAALQDSSATIAFSGAGTSAYVGDIIAPTVAQFSKAHCHSVTSTDFVSNPLACVPKNAHGLFVAFARSGNSPESVDSIEKIAAIAPKMQPVSVSCNASGQLAQDSRCLSLLMPRETHDESFVMTSSFSTMTLYTASLCRQACGAKPLDIDAIAQASDALNDTGYDTPVFDILASAKQLIFLGSNTLYGATREAALKILEMNAGSVPTMAETSLGFRHGPKSWVNDETAVIVFASNHNYTQQFDADIIAELANDNLAKNIIVLATQAFFTRFPTLLKQEKIIALHYDKTLDNVADEGLAVLGVQYGQLLGLRTAISRNISSDNPCPSGEVNRVVQGVKLYPYIE